jgi:dipeptidyl aminopeptidase/acylaminoacyl peptidase
VPYAIPDSDIVSIIDAPPTPNALLAPDGSLAVLVHYESHPPVAVLARPYLSLGGIRVDPVIAGRQRTRRITALSVLRIAAGAEQALALPAGAQLGTPAWAPDGRRFAFTVDEGDGIGVWVADAQQASAAQVPGLRVRDVLGGDPLSVSNTVRWSRDGSALIVLGAPAERLALPDPPAGPQIEEVTGKHSQMATFQDLLRTAADEDVFEALATTLPLRVDPVTGAVKELGPAGLYRLIEESPDGAYLLVHLLQRPFSFRVPYPYFARRTELWAAAGGLVRVVADIGVSDEVPRHGVPAGPRQVSWDERSPASLVWVEALDGGDPMTAAEHRDQIVGLSAPFTGEPQLAFRVQHRCIGWADMDRPHSLMLTEHDRDRRWLTTWLCDLGDPERNRVLFDLSADDAYADPGLPLMMVHPDGTRTVLQDQSFIYLRGNGATPDGDRPFLDRLDLESGQLTRLFHCPPESFEQVLGFTSGGRDEVVLYHESPAEPPNLLAAALDGSCARSLTRWPDPHPRLTGMDKRLVVHDRGDGVQLSGMLYLPPGYDPERDGRLPLLIWAYPLDYGGADTAGQIRGSSKRFTRLAASEPVWFVLRGYAVLTQATMPVIGDPETMNDTFVGQITMAAAAHISALAELGIADTARVAVGGHSYGAFMTANLLAHTDLFAAGIARSGAYNRSLTPFGFQTERRNFWEATAVYDQVSPLRYADQITAPILLIHGMQDNNSGTFPMQSERLFQALQGNGGTARLVLLPHESHGYLGRESVLHVLAEQFGWLERWLHA